MNKFENDDEQFARECSLLRLPAVNTCRLLEIAFLSKILLLVRLVLAAARGEGWGWENRGLVGSGLSFDALY